MTASLICRWALAICAAFTILVAPVQRRANAYDQEGHVFCKYSYSGSGLIYPVLRNDPDLPPSDFVGIPQVYESARAGWNASAAPVSMVLTSSGEAWIGAYFMDLTDPTAQRAITARGQATYGMAPPRT